MVYDQLSRMQKAGQLSSCQIYFSPSEGKTDIILGSEIRMVNRSFLQCSTGDLGTEEMRVMLEWISAIVVSGQPVWERKKRVQKVYPR